MSGYILINGTEHGAFATFPDGKVSVKLEDAGFPSGPRGEPGRQSKNFKNEADAVAFIRENAVLWRGGPVEFVEFVQSRPA